MKHTALILTAVVGVIALNWCAAFSVTALIVLTDRSGALPQHAYEPSIAPTAARTSGAHTAPVKAAEYQATDTAEVVAPVETPAVLTPSCQTISAETAGITDVAWEKYKRSLEDTWVIEWQGTVRQVSDKGVLTFGMYPINVDVEGGCELYLTIASEEEAMRYQIGDRVTVSGQVRSMVNILGSNVLYLRPQELTITKN